MSGQPNFSQTQLQYWLCLQTICGDIDKTRALLAMKANPNLQYSGGGHITGYRYALHNAVGVRSLALTRQLLDHKADPNKRARHNLLPLTLALLPPNASMYRNNFLRSRIRVFEGDIVDLLINAKASLETAAIDAPGALITLTSEARDPRNLGLIQQLVAFGLDINYCGIRGIDPLENAIAQHGNTTFIQPLLELKAGLTQGYAGEPIIVCANHNRVEALKLLLSAKFSPEHRTQQRTPLWHAANVGHIDIMRTLLAAKASIGSITEDGQDEREATELPILGAARMGQRHSLALLLDAKASVNQPDSRGLFPLLAAICVPSYRNSNPASVSLLLDKKAEVNAVFNGPEIGELRISPNSTPLAQAVLRGAVSIVQILLRAKTNTVQPSDNNIISIAAQHGNHMVIQALINAKAPLGDHEGQPALKLAAQGDHSTMIEILSQAKADIDARFEGRNGNTQTVLREAIINHRLGACATLLKISRPPFDDKAPSLPHLAICHRHTARHVMSILRSKAPALIADQDGNTALHAAAEMNRGGKGLFQKLIQMKADPNQANHQGETPLSILKAKEPPRKRARRETPGMNGGSA